MTKLLASAFTPPLVLVLVVACGGEPFSAGAGGSSGDSGGQDGTGAKSDEAGSSGKKGSGAAGAGSGSSNGGTAGGGSNAAGGSSSGTSSGGSSSAGADPGGGASSGGTSNGGMSSGGASDGGMSSGGMSSGGIGSATSCDSDQDCVACAYDKAPASAMECYCVGCADAPMNKKACSANQASYEAACADAHLVCPAIKCVPLMPVKCDKHRCVDVL